MTLSESDGSVLDDAIGRDRTEDVVVVQRPWGHFEQFSLNEPATVKTITVEPGQRLSLQTHARRAELWQVLDGRPDVTVAERTWTARTGELVWVPLGAPHRLGNATDEVVRVLEVGFGHFDEDDIVRIEDDYAR